MAHFLDPMKKKKRSNTHVNKLVSELVMVAIFIYDHNFTITCDDRMINL